MEESLNKHLQDVERYVLDDDSKIEKVRSIRKDLLSKIRSEEEITNDVRRGFLIYAENLKSTSDLNNIDSVIKSCHLDAGENLSKVQINQIYDGGDTKIFENYKTLDVVSDLKKYVKYMLEVHTENHFSALLDYFEQEFSLETPRQGFMSISSQKPVQTYDGSVQEIDSMDSFRQFKSCMFSLYTNYEFQMETLCYLLTSCDPMYSNPSRFVGNTISSLHRTLGKQDFELIRRNIPTVKRMIDELEFQVRNSLGHGGSESQFYPLNKDFSRYKIVTSSFDKSVDEEYVISQYYRLVMLCLVINYVVRYLITISVVSES